MRRFILLSITSCFSLSIISCATVAKNVEVIDSDGMALVTGGCFYMGSDDGEFNEAPEHEVYVECYAPNWRGPYMAQVTKDPWGNSYITNANSFATAGQPVWIISAGPNRSELA